jgi:hypothetical protein
MRKKPSIVSLGALTLAEASAYIEYAKRDDLAAAVCLAVDRNRFDGCTDAPDDAEVHHALFLLCHARGLATPSFDETRVKLRRRPAA